MAREVPVNKTELLQILGVGGVTLERFGKRFLEILRLHNQNLNREH